MEHENYISPEQSSKVTTDTTKLKIISGNGKLEVGDINI